MKEDPQMSTEQTALPDNPVVIGPSTEKSPPEILQVTLNGEDIELKVDGQQSVLECLIDKGHDPPYSCMEGVCMACLAKVTEGAVYQSDPGILADENVENNETLTCQCRPITRIVGINYDGF